ncbi:MAG TPA: hypothetical protein VG602_03085, partial [Actinomycetota bacterium]|nr:hypothetical protein [Actinomycetota bacterium]
LYMIQLSGGASVQGYVDPGAAGENELHFTFFDPAGGELPVEAATMDAVPGKGEARTLDVRRLGPGHFVAGVELDAGPWRFSVEATAEDGAALSAEFEEEIEG